MASVPLVLRHQRQEHTILAWNGTTVRGFNSHKIENNVFFSCVLHSISCFLTAALENANSIV
jgi:hypothetical protein